MSTEWGIFTDEGCVEDGFTSAEAAEAVRLARYYDDEAEVLPVCHDHEGQASTRCEACDSGDDSDLDD